MTNKTLFACCLGLSLIVKVQAQLAITEVMTGESDKNHPDWFELHNYGTNDIDLTGYSWNDDSHGGLSGADAAPFDGVIIHSNETIIFTEPATAITSPADFRTWWGIPDSVQVVMLGAADNALGKGGDDVRLWSTNLAALGSNTNGLDLDECADYLVQQLATGPTTDQSLLYDSTNGLYDILSVSGIDGAFTAATTADVGSPGVAPDAVPATITTVPADAGVSLGGSVTFTNAGLGLPPLVYHWYVDGTPVTSQTPGISILYTNNTSVLTLNGAETTAPSDHTCEVIADNGLQSFTNSASLTVSAVPTAPTITSAPLDSFDAYLGQTVPLTVSASGYPDPIYQWYSNNVAMVGETGNVLTLSLSDTNQSAVYSVIVTNSAGGTNVSVALNVTPVPNVVVTEVESSEGTNNANGDPSGHGDWFELSNLGDFPVNLRGFRVDDNHATLTDASTITNQVIIHPSESVVFVQDMAPDQFRNWWGTNLSPNVQIIDYSGSGFGSGGDGVTVWNAAATDNAGYLDLVTCGAATQGNTFGFDLNYLDQTGFDGFTLTTPGFDGAFMAAVGGDIGSPGTLVTPTSSLVARTMSDGLHLSWTGQPNWTYYVQYKTNLTDTTWTTLPGNISSEGSGAATYTDTSTDPQRFYRVFLNLNNE